MVRIPLNEGQILRDSFKNLLDVLVEPVPGIFVIDGIWSLDWEIVLFVARAP